MVKCYMVHPDHGVTPVYSVDVEADNVKNGWKRMTPEQQKHYLKTGKYEQNPKVEETPEPEEVLPGAKRVSKKKK